MTSIDSQLFPYLANLLRSSREGSRWQCRCGRALRMCYFYVNDWMIRAFPDLSKHLVTTVSKLMLIEPRATIC